MFKIGRVYSYSDLAGRLHDIATLNSIAGIVGWDEQVMMPAGATQFRAEQAALLAKLVHERQTDPLLAAMVEQVGAGNLDDDQRVVVRELRYDLKRAADLPVALVTEISRTTVLSQAAWVEARQDKDFSKFAPWLDKVVTLKRQVAACHGSDSGDPYDALLESYEPGETAAGLRPMFDTLVPALVDLVQKVRGSRRQPPLHLLTRRLPVDAQQKFAVEAAAALGFDANAGRLDASVHPFCTGIAPGDTRITTRYAEDDFLGALLGTLHETGHALYEQGLPKTTAYGTPLAEATSLGMHESQSRLWENQVGRGEAFWTFFWPKMANKFGTAFIDVSKHDWLFALNASQPTFIRTEADELTYNLHIAIRFELEHAMINGNLAVADLPAAWNERMQKTLGITPPDDALGCLQDVHWSAGLIGYFPTYTLGNLYAAMFHEAVSAARPQLQAELAAGHFEGLLGWLRENIHRHGRRYRARELCLRITGKSPTADALLRRLTDKVSRYYGA